MPRQADRPHSSGKPLLDFWRGKRVLLTGHTGFKGSWLTLWLHRFGARVTGFALAPDTNPNLFESAHVSDCCESILGDIRRYDDLAAALLAVQPEIVLHLAAQSLVQRSYRDPVVTYETNVMGTVNLLEAVRRTASVGAIVIVTSDKCYENRESIWGYRENEALGGDDPYSSSKACAEIVVAAWRRSFLKDTGAAMASARAGNVIGGGDWAENRLVPDCIRAMNGNEPIFIRNPHATRPWQHVLEPLSGYLMLAERLWTERSAVAEAWNFGPAADDVEPVSRIADRLTQLWGEGARWIPHAQNSGHEAGLLAVDSAKARARLDWRPRLRLPTALEWTVRWYKCHGEGVPANALVLADIERYEAIRP